MDRRWGRSFRDTKFECPSRDDQIHYLEF